LFWLRVTLPALTAATSKVAAIAVANRQRHEGPRKYFRTERERVWLWEVSADGAGNSLLI